MRILCGLAALLCWTLSGCNALTTAPHSANRLEFDHYDPVALNEFAIAKVREGDTTTAWILLERAARLAPHDARIARNLAVLRAFRAGTPLAAVPERSSPARAVGSNDIGITADKPLPEPPALWKAKQDGP